MKKCILVLTILLAFQYHAHAQDSQNQEGTPVIGWDSLKSMIFFPEIARRAGIQAYAHVEVRIDSVGNVTGTNVVAHELFYQAIDEVIKKVKWYPAYSNGMPQSTKAHFEILFQFRDFDYTSKRKILKI